MAGRLYRMAKVVSANPASWGIVDANQISGFRTVATQADLYSIAACILSSSYGDGTTTGADAVGQIWHVQDTNKDFRLTSWANRGKAAGWTEELTSAKLSEGIASATKAASAAQEIATEAGKAASAAQTTANDAKSQAETATGKAEANGELITALQGTVNTINKTVSGHTTSIDAINTALDGKAENSVVNKLRKTVGGHTTEIGEIKEQLTNIDTTLYELAPNNTLPSTLADINKNHIYLVKADTAGTNNVYAEYIYTGTSATYDATKWEKLGEVSAKVDLSEYATTTYVQNAVGTAKHDVKPDTVNFTKHTGTTDLDIDIRNSDGTKLTKPVSIPLVNIDNNTNGLMSPAMLTKLNSLNNYTHPEHTAHTSGLYKITVDGLGHVSATANVEAKDLKAAGALTSAPAFELGSAVHPDKITINASYNGTNHPVDIAEADSKHPGLISPALYDKLTGITVKDTVTSTGTDAVSGKAVWNHVYNYKIHGDNVGNEVNGTSYTIVARSDDDNTVTCLTDALTLNYNATNHSNLVVDSAVVWDGENLKAISNDRLTEILV